MFDEILIDIEEKMDNSIKALQKNFAQIRTGRANANILDNIKVDYYGVPTPINQMAAIKIPDAHQIVIEPWEKSQLSVIEKAISESDLGINPNNDGRAVRIPFPKLTEESRRELVKKCNKLAEEGRVSIRNARREGNSCISKFVKKENLSEDDERRAQDEVQKLTDKYVKIVDQVFSKKEKEVMEV